MDIRGLIHGQNGQTGIYIIISIYIYIYILMRTWCSPRVDTHGVLSSWSHPCPCLCDDMSLLQRSAGKRFLLSQNTTKWVKKALRAKGGAGQDDRKAISEQLRLGQELRAKVKFNLRVTSCL